MAEPVLRAMACANHAYSRIVAPWVGFRLSIVLLTAARRRLRAVTDSEQLRLCRLILPVLHAEGTEIQEISVAPRGRSGLRIDYTAREPAWHGAHSSSPAVSAGPRSSAAGSISSRSIPTAATVVRPGCSSSSVSRRGGPRHSAAPPGAAATAGRPGLCAAAADQCAASRAIYALLATAYSLIYGLVGRSICAFGEIAVLGAYGRSAAVSGGGRSASATRSRLARTRAC
jgi:branched-chain amino acid transport system permease protein